MNYRGKNLTKLELLKNRLFYLATLFDQRKKELQELIKNTWKTIYEYLDKNGNDPLDDDTFLRNHWIMYFKIQRKEN